MSGVLQDVVNSIFEPGVNRGLLLVLHTACGALLVTLIAIAFYTQGNGHVLALLAIATALWISITWYGSNTHSSTNVVVSVGLKDRLCP